MPVRSASYVYVYGMFVCVCCICLVFCTCIVDYWERSRCLLTKLCKVPPCKFLLFAHSALFPLILSFSGFLPPSCRALFRPLFPSFYLFRVSSRSRSFQRLFWAFFRLVGLDCRFLGSCRRRLFPRLLGAIFRPRLLPFFPRVRFGLPILVLF